MRIRRHTKGWLGGRTAPQRVSCQLILLLYARQRVQRVARVLRIMTSLVSFDRIVVVLNNPELKGLNGDDLLEGLGSRVEFTDHDNTGMEFGGYQAGVDVLKGRTADRIVVMNDTVGSHIFVDKAWLAAFLRALLDDREAGLLVGKIDTLERVFELGGYRSSRWVRSHIFGMDRTALESIQYQLLCTEALQFIRDCPEPGQFFGPEVGDAMREHISRWLFATSGARWYGAGPLTAINCRLMAGKARSIVQEKLLSMRLESVGSALRRPLMTSGETRQHEFLRHLSRLMRRTTPK